MYTPTLLAYVSAHLYAGRLHNLMAYFYHTYARSVICYSLAVGMVRGS